MACSIVHQKEQRELEEDVRSRQLEKSRHLVLELNNLYARLRLMAVADGCAIYGNGCACVRLLVIWKKKQERIVVTVLVEPAGYKTLTS